MQTEARNITMRILAVLLGVVVGVGLGWAGWFLHLKWAQRHQREALPGAARLAHALNVGMDIHYVRLMEALSQGREESFRSVDTFTGMAMSRDLFQPEEMFGVARYRFLPNIRVSDISIWNGIKYQSMQIALTPETGPLLTACTLRHRIDFETDMHGFKKALSDVSSAAPVIFFLGDSYTEGLHVASGDTFVALFGKHLAAAGKAVNPLNLGVGGYGTMEECWMLEYFGPILKPAAVILNMFPNDVARDQNSVVLGVGVPPEAYETMFGYLRRIRDYCLREEIWLVVSVIPTPTQVGELRRSADFQNRVGQWCQEQNVLFLNPHKKFVEAGDELYISWESHLSPIGHRLYADFLYREVGEQVKAVINTSRRKTEPPIGADTRR